MKKVISWVEIPAKDFDRAVKFYNSILSLNLKKIECESEKMAFLPNDEGAISFAADFNPSKDGALISLNAGDHIDDILVKIEKSGGSIVQSKTKIQSEVRGFFALFHDTEGNRLGLYGN